MSRVDAAAASDRLPWLQDEPKRPLARRGGHSVLGWATAAIILVGAAAFWFGVRSVDEQPTARSPAPTTTVPLPRPRPAEPQEVRLPAQPEVSPAPAPQVRQVPDRQVRIAMPPAQHPARAETVKSAAPEKEAERTAAPAPVTAAPAASPRPFVMPKPWNPRVFAGAAGRVVQIGAFGSVHQAKLGWRYMVRAYPAVSHLPAVVRPTRNSKGRVFYRFQVGTTSQAHSEVLCQRMEGIHFSCAVVDLPWKAKVER